MEGDDEPSGTMIDEEIPANGIKEEKQSRPIISGEQLDIEAYASLYTARTKIMRLLFIANHCVNQTMQLEALRMAYDEIKKGENKQLFREVVQKIDGRLGPSAWCETVDRRAEQKKEKLENELNAYKVGAFSVLKELVVVLPDYLVDHIGSLILGIEKALSDKSSTSNLKIEALIFTRLVLSSHSPSVFHPYVKALSSPGLAVVGECYYRVTAEALRVCGELVLVVRPNIEGIGFNFKPYVHPIYNAIMSRLTNQDQD